MQSNIGLKNVPLAPSFLALTFTGFILIIVIVILLCNFKQILKTTPIELIGFMCILSIAIGSHGLLHLGLEHVYGYNPLKWF